MRPPERNEADRIRSGHNPVAAAPPRKPGYGLARIPRTTETAEAIMALAQESEFWPYVTRKAPYAAGKFWTWHLRPGYPKGAKWVAQETT